jgi:cytoskeletal protein CcmA (bactofilin family)
MFASKHRGTVIAKGLKIVGSVTAEGLVEVNGQIEGEMHCTSVIVSRGAHVCGTISAERVIVDGTVEGPIQGGEVILKSQAHVVGDIHHQSLSIESGAYFDGRSQQTRAANGRKPQKLARKPIREMAHKESEAASTVG